MARQIPDDRLAQLLEAATGVFIEQGYRRTQMADVAAALGVAKGTLYLYVESKEALFDLVCRYADHAAVGERRTAVSRSDRRRPGRPCATSRERARAASGRSRPDRGARRDSAHADVASELERNRARALRPARAQSPADQAHRHVGARLSRAGRALVRGSARQGSWRSSPTT